MTVHSKPYVSEQTATPKPSTARKGAWAVGFAVIALGCILWSIGGKYTFDGWAAWINGFLAFFQLPIRVPQPTGWWILLFVPLAYTYSRVEVKHRPFTWDKEKNMPILSSDLIFWGAWLFIVGTDIGTTFVGSRQPSAQVWGMLQPAMLQIAASDWLSGIWATILTFIPEWLILGGVWLLRR